MKKTSKFIALFLVAVLTLAISATVFAAEGESPTAIPVVKHAYNNGDPTDYKVEIELSSTSQELTQATIDSLEGKGYELAVKVDAVTKDGFDAVFPMEITFFVEGADADSRVLHFEDGAWVDVTVGAASGEITGLFKSLSPVAFLIKKQAATSPETGADYLPVVLAIAAVLALGGAVAAKARS